MIKTEGLTKVYGNVRALDALDMEVKRGEIFGFIGPNGAGKTTTIRILAGLMRPTSGKATISGYDVTRESDKVKRLVGYMPDFFGVYGEMRVWEYLDFFGAAYRVPVRTRKVRIERILDITAAAYMRDYFLSSLSRGMKQKVGIARTLVHDPDLLLLDEPASGLDPKARIEMRRLLKTLRDEGKTILLSSHILAEIATSCDRVGIIQNSHLLASGRVEEIMQHIREHRLIEVEVTGEPARARAIMQGAPGVRKIETFDNLLRLEFTGQQEEISSLLKELVKQDVDLLWFREVPADLEEVFMSITETSE